MSTSDNWREEREFLLADLKYLTCPICPLIPAALALVSTGNFGADTDVTEIQTDFTGIAYFMTYSFSSSSEFIGFHPVAVPVLSNS
jgi:hypothetical protein